MRRFTGVVAAGVLVAGLAGCSANPPNNIVAPKSDSTTTITKYTDDEKVVLWGNQNTAVFKSVSTDVAKVLGSYFKADIDQTTLLQACTALATDVAAAQKSALPAPHQEIQTPLKASLALYARGAASCKSGIEDGDTTELKAAANSFSHAAKYVEQLRKVLGITETSSTATATSST